MRLPRSALPWWAAVVALAAVTGLLVSGLVQRAGEAQARYGDLRPVLVATADLRPGDRLDAGRTEVRRLPASFVPDGALLARPAQRTVVAEVARGEVVLARRVSRSGQGATGLMPAGSRAIAVPTPVTGLPVRPGDHVDLLATADAREGNDGVVARDGTVIAVTGPSTTVAVAADEAPAVGRALGAGGLVIALRSP